MSDGQQMNHPFFQVGLLVQDIEAARQELSDALGLTWTEILSRRNGDWDLRICFSHEGPPHLELIEGPDGSPWDASGGSRIDHIGYWASDLGRATDTLEDAGMEVELDGRTIGGSFAYHRGSAGASGLRIESLDDSYRDLFYERFGLQPPSGSV